MVALNQIQQTTFVYDTKGVDETRAKVERLGSSLDKLATSQDRSASAEDKGSAASEKAAAAKARYEAALARSQRQMDMEARSIAAAQQAQDAMNASVGAYGDAQARAMRGQEVANRAFNDNAASIGRQTSAYEEAGKAALHHPILAIAGASLASRALAGLATSAGVSLGVASGVVQKFANDNAAMGQGAAVAAALAARGLGMASTAATTAGASLGTAAEKMSGMTAATSLLTRGLTSIPPAALPIAAALAVFLAGAMAIEKANGDLDRLIQLGERAKSLDIAAPFVKSFEALGPAIHASADEMDAALKRASDLVKDQFNQENAAGKLLREISATGVAGAGGLAAEGQFNAASSTQERIQATLAGMKELEALGLRLAAVDLGSKVFGPELIERLRTGNVSMAEFADRVEAASQKEVLRQEQVDRALALNRAIADTKQAISDALGVTFDFSAAGMLINEAWLKILQAVRWIVEALNDGIAAVTNFGAAVASSIGGAFDAVTTKATALLTTLGLVAKAQATAKVPGQADPEFYGVLVPKITAVQRNDIAGPPAPAFQQAAAKQAAQAAQAADDAFDSALRRSKDQVEEFNLQAASAGKATEEVYKLTEANRLRRAAASAGRSDEEGIAEAIDAQAAALARARKASEDAHEAQRRLQEGQRELANEFSTFAEDVLLGGTKIGDAFNTLAKSLSGNSLKALISGEGPLAGILGTASTEKGQLGGLLGGKVNLGGLFDTDKITDALGIGAETGIGKALSEALKPRTGANGQSLGALSSPLGGALGSAAVGGSIGYTSQSPLLGALSGAASGYMMAGPVGAVVGAGAGLIGGLLGESEAKKAAKKKLQQEIQARREALDAARPQIEQLDATFSGISLGTVGKQVKDAQAQLIQAVKTASEGGDQALANKLMADFQAYMRRLDDAFAASFNGTLDEIRAGLGTNGPFAQAAAQAQQFGETLKAVVADAGRLGTEAQGRAQAAAVEGALASLQTPPTLSATQTEMARIQGTAAGLTQVLKDLGLSADQAAAAIADRTTKALDALRDKFSTDLTRKINEAQGNSYLNDAADLIKEVAGLNADATAIGGDLGRVQTYFQAAAQKIVDSSQLTGDAFDRLVQQFPELTGLVHAFDSSLTDAAATLEAISARRTGYQDRTFAAGNDATTEAGSLAAFDRKAEQDRAAEVKAGGQALVDLETAQSAERLQIVTDFATKAADALNTRLKGYADRLFEATTDSTTLDGQLAAYDRKAGQERLDEVKAGGQALVDLEAAQGAERLKIVTDFAKQAADALAQRLQSYGDRFFAATNDSTTLDGKLAAYDRQAEMDRATEVKAGGDAIVALETAQGAERLKIITDFAKAATDALNTRLKGYADRFFAATNDSTTLAGQLAAYDRQAQTEREDEIKAGGNAIAELEQTQAAERLKIITDFGKQAADALEQQLDAAQTAYEAFAKNIKTYLGELTAGSNSPLAPKDRLASAQTQYNAQYALAQGGNRDALDSITTYAQTLIEASRAYNASNSAFQSTFQAVQQQLAALPTQVSAEQFIVNAITDSKTALVAATEAMRASLLAGIQSNSPTLVATALNANFSRLDTSVNGLLDYNEFLAGVGPLATTAEQQAARNIFNAIDANGDGQISRLEAANASSYRVEGFTSATKDTVAAGNNILDYQNAILNNQSTLLNSQNAIATQQFSLLDAIKGLNGQQTTLLGNQNNIATQQATLLDAIKGLSGQQTTLLNGQSTTAAQQSTLLDSINGLSGQQAGLMGQLVSINNQINAQTAATQSTSNSSASLLKATYDFDHAIFDTLSLSLNNQRSANAKAGAAVYAAGGWVSGPGTGTSDSIAARLSNGEFVVTAAAARLYGPLLEAMNDNGGAFAMPAVAMPMPVAVGGRDDDGETAALLKEQNRLIAEQNALLRRQIETTAAGAQYVGGKVDDHAAETRRGNADRRQDANRPRTAGTRAA